MGTATIEAAPRPTGADESSGVRSALFNMRTVSAVLAVALIAAGLYWLLKADDALAAMTLQTKAGSVHVLRDGKALGVDDTFSLSPGDVVSTASGSRARLRLEGERRLEMAGASEIRIIDGTRVESRTGKVLADTSDKMKIMVGDVVTSATSASFRIDNQVGSARAGVYEGTISVDGPGSAPLSVGELFQTSISGGQVLERDPYALNEDDYWDKFRLKSILNLNHDFELAKRGFAAQLGGSRPDLAYFDALANDDVSFMKPYLARKELRNADFTSDLMVGFMIATHARGSAANAFDRAYDLFFEKDATWGVVAGITLGRDTGRMHSALADLEAAYADTGVLAGSTGSEPEFKLADKAAGSAGAGGGGGSSSRSGGTTATGPGDTSGGDGGGSGGDDPNTTDPGGGGGDDPGSGGGEDPGGGDDPGGGGCDVECQVKDILPSPPPDLKPPP